MIAASLVLQLVFVHANGKVALERHPGDASYVLFDVGNEPARTPDGKRLFWWAGDGIHVADVDGPARKLWRAGNLRSPRVSPDGATLLWNEVVDGKWAVMRSPIAEPAPRVMFRVPGHHVYQPAWLPDGGGIIAHGDETVYWVARDGSITRTLAIGDLAPDGELWASSRVLVCPSDANRLLYDLQRGEEWSLWLFDLVTAKRTRLTPADVEAADPIWSRDGRFVYFRGSRKRGKPIRDGILRIAADGSGLVRVLPGREPSP